MAPALVACSTMAEPRGLKGLVFKAWKSWATRSLAVGGVATVFDVGVGLFMLKVVGTSTRPSAMCGVFVGAVFTFLANRFFAFREHRPRLASPAIKFALATAVSMLIHGQLVVFLRDGMGVPFVIAKLLADGCVFSVGQLLLLRYLVFPRRDEPAPTSAVVPPGVPVELGQGTER